MIDKAKTILTILLLLILAFSIIYSGLKIINSLFEKPVLLNSGKLEEYTQKENVVLTYSTFYYISDCLDNFIEACNREKFEDLYKLYIEEYTVQYTKEEIISKLNDFKVNEEVSYKLKEVYSISDKYILNIEIGDKTEYLIFDLNNKEEYSYYFAFLK